ncbi:DUF4132 domain-containing protein [Salinicola sp. JS01]|uniref:DUF4132 domain-containing protein n=1 Tax=Salinicola sp. JS01 TaxID=3050071 RepID=UPI00255B9639|nr:DUF4132 domain-containing protein [Salinicola sp. JS01]WIX31894.1 DUF4132 domain-containing protein [Salinicola sp. JS01]
MLSGRTLFELRELRLAGDSKGDAPELLVMIDTLFFIDRQRAFPLTPELCLERLSSLLSCASGKSGKRLRASLVSNVIRFLQRCTDPAVHILQDVLLQLLNNDVTRSATPSWKEVYIRLAITGCLLPENIGKVQSFGKDFSSSSPIFSDEFGLVCSWPVGTKLDWAGLFLDDDVDDTQIIPARDPLWDVIEQCPGYGGFAKKALQVAAQRLTEIHNGALPYRADGAFDGAEIAALDRASRYALRRDEEWGHAVMMRLLPDASVAPTSAKTAPSQALAFGLAKAIATFPTPEAITALREANRVVRHAALAKRLRRELGAAERELPFWPERALRIAAHKKLNRTQRATLINALEGSFYTSNRFTFDHWRYLSQRYPGVLSLFESLVWRVTINQKKTVSFIPRFHEDEVFGIECLDSSGKCVEPFPDTAMVDLWHPSEADEEERQAWQHYVVKRRLKQPFRQIWRECFTAPDSSTPSPYPYQMLSVKPFAGLARKQGWVNDRDGCYYRLFGPLRLVLELSDRVVPGSTGVVEIKMLKLFESTHSGFRPISFVEIPTRLASEMLRCVDLLVSVATIAEKASVSLSPAERTRRESAAMFLAHGRTASAMTQLRRDALEKLFEGYDARIVFDGHYVRLEDFAIHLGSSVVFHKGERVDFNIPDQPRSAQVPWLPYDEALLERIVMILMVIREQVK